MKIEFSNLYYIIILYSMAMPRQIHLVQLWGGILEVNWYYRGSFRGNPREEDLYVLR